MKIRTYSELIKLPTFEERFSYLKLSGQVGTTTFGYDRWLNQNFYRSSEWLRMRDRIIVRDNGCDLGLDGYDIYDEILIHHMNPIQIDDLVERKSHVLNPEFLICTTKRTHNAIHYGNDDMKNYGLPVDRKANDTCPWK